MQQYVQLLCHFTSGGKVNANELQYEKDQHLRFCNENQKMWKRESNWVELDFLGLQSTRIATYNNYYVKERLALAIQINLACIIILRLVVSYGRARFPSSAVNRLGPVRKETKRDYQYYVNYNNSYTHVVVQQERLGFWSQYFAGISCCSHQMSSSHSSSQWTSPCTIHHYQLCGNLQLQYWILSGWTFITSLSTAGWQCWSVDRT